LIDFLLALPEKLLMMKGGSECADLPVDGRYAANIFIAIIKLTGGKRLWQLNHLQDVLISLTNLSK
jgi:hypothetical protein